MHRYAYASLVCLGLTAGCATGRSLLISADVAVSQAVFAIDTAESTACLERALTVAQCAALDPKIQKALVDVQTVTRDVQLLPTTVPASVPALLADLTDLYTIAQTIPALKTLTADAAAKATTLYTQLGGK